MGQCVVICPSGLYSASARLTETTAKALANNQWSLKLTTISEHGAVRLPAGVSTAQYRMLFTAQDGLTTNIGLSSFHKVGSDDDWDYYVDNLALGDAVASITLQVTSDAAHVGTSTFGGNLQQNKVYAQVKEIVKAGDNITITPKDGTAELTLASTASGGSGGDLLLLDTGIEAVAWARTTTPKNTGTMTRKLFDIGATLNTYTIALTDYIKVHVAWEIPLSTSSWSNWQYVAFEDIIDPQMFTTSRNRSSWSEFVRGRIQSASLNDSGVLTLEHYMLITNSSVTHSSILTSSATYPHQE